MSVATWVRPQVWMAVVRLGLIGAGALLAADAVNQWLLTRLPLPVITKAVAPETVAVTPTRKAPTDYRRINARNIFNSTPAAAPVAAPVVTESVEPLNVVQPLNLNVRLTGTVVGATPAQSFAFIMDVAKRTESLFRIGDKVLDEGVVAEVGRDSVRLTRGGAEQVIRLFEENKKTGPGAPIASISPASPAAEEFSFAIDRQEVEEALADMPRLLTQARLLPNFRAGQTDGFRIFNIVPGSLFSKIGLKNGDVLHRINEVEINDPTKFMGLFSDLKNQSHISLDLVRGKDRKTFEYEIR
ncbi:MAG: type II secretion system protein GspC [Leptospirillia bacterium]